MVKSISFQRNCERFSCPDGIGWDAANFGLEGTGRRVLTTIGLIEEYTRRTLKEANSEDNIGPFCTATVVCDAAIEVPVQDENGPSVIRICGARVIHFDGDTPAIGTY